MSASQGAAPRFSIRSLDLFEREVRLRLPFRFGVVTLTESPQAFVRARIRLEDGTESAGGAAEMLAPKWFDKNLALTNEDNFQQLRRSLAIARAAYPVGRRGLRVRAFQRALPLADRGLRGRGAQFTHRLLRPGARRSRAARRAVPRARRFVLCGGARQPARRGCLAHRRSRRIRCRGLPRLARSPRHRSPRATRSGCSIRSPRPTRASG